jgi:precorrin-3B methylase
MPPMDPSLELRLPELSYGSIWLVSAGTGDPRDLSPLALHAVATADAVIHDPGLSPKFLQLVEPSRYSEAVPPRLAIERSIKLAQDGWRVVQVVAGNALQRAFASVVHCAERNIPLRVVPSVGEDREAPLGIFLARKSVSLGRSDPASALVLLVAAAQTEAASEPEQHQPPLGFSMSGLAG